MLPIITVTHLRIDVLRAGVVTMPELFNLTCLVAALRCSEKAWQNSLVNSFCAWI